MSETTLNTPNLTPRDVEIICALFQSLKSKPDIDMDRFATLGGFTKASATTVFSRTLKKVMSEASTTPQSNKKPLGRKRKDDEAIDDEAEETPSKKKGRAAKGKGKGKKKTDMDGEVEDDNEDNAVVKGEGEDDGADELS